MFEKLEELAKNNKKISDFHIRSGWPLAYRPVSYTHLTLPTTTPV